MTGVQTCALPICRQLGGVGLGLALVREIVRVHDGRITVQSSPSGGTIFEVVFTPVSYTHLDVYKRQVLNPAVLVVTD